MQQDNYIKNKLQQLDNQQLPDLSHMDEHWKNMQASLPPPSKLPPKNLLGKAALGLIAAAVIVAAVMLINNNKASRQTKVTGEKNTTAQPATQVVSDTIAAIKTLTDSPVVQTRQSVYPPKKFQVNVGINKEIVKTAGPFILPADSIPVNGAAAEPAISDIQKQQLLEQLFNGLVKTAQELTINNAKDTLLVCEEGAALFIPANSLNNGMVTISVKEFYKKSDIVLNKLMTTSNSNQLISGGMLHITASANGQPVQLSAVKPMTIYLPDTSAAMKQMQLFTGQEKSTPANYARQNMDTAAFGGLVNNVNWMPQPQYFATTKIITEAWVLDLRNEPFRAETRRKGLFGAFVLVRKPKLPKEKIRQLLKEKYGYNKVRFSFKENSYNHGWYESGLMDYMEFSDIPIGDSVWLDKNKADKYKLPYTVTRSYLETNAINGRRTAPLTKVINNDLVDKIKGRYHVDIASLGWINCDRFYNDTRPKVSYTVNLGDNASNYYTMLVFDKIKSVLNGNVNGNQVLFYNVPAGEPVTIVSIGITKNGSPVVAIKKAIIDKKELDGLQFETTAAPVIKASLSRIDD